MSRIGLICTIIIALLSSGCRPNEHSYSQMFGALETSDYTSAREQSESLQGYAARFVEGVACYRLEDYACAIQAFAKAAWTADNRKARGSAVFNLANTYFKTADYEQAAVLFRDAQMLGISSSLTQQNLAFAQSLAVSVRQWRAAIEETERRAVWRANANAMPEGFEDRLAQGVYFSRPPSESAILKTLSDANFNTLVSRGVQRIGSTENTEAKGQRQFPPLSGYLSPLLLTFIVWGLTLWDCRLLAHGKEPVGRLDMRQQPAH